MIQNYTLIFNIVKIKIIHILKKHTNLQCVATYDEKINFKKSQHILEDVTSDVQVDDIGQVIYENFV
jgi:hypothetical protein